MFWKLADQDREAVSADQDFNQVTNGEVPFCYELDLKGSDPVEVACP